MNAGLSDRDRGRPPGGVCCCPEVSGDLSDNSLTVGTFVMTSYSDNMVLEFAVRTGLILQKLSSPASDMSSNDALSNVLLKTPGMIR